MARELLPLRAECHANSDLLRSLAHDIAHHRVDANARKRQRDGRRIGLAVDDAEGVVAFDFESLVTSGAQGMLLGFPYDGYFIDIGVPDDLARWPGPLE